MKQLFSGMILAATLVFSNVANATLILDQDSSFTTSNGGVSWDLGDALINTFDPIQIVDADGFFATDIFNALISNIGLGVTAQPINTTGGSIDINQWYRFGSPSGDGLLANTNLSFLYNVTQFTFDNFKADLTGIFTFEGQAFDITGSIFGANNPGSNNSAWTWKVDYFAPVNNPGGSVSVNEPIMLGAFLFLPFLIRRKKQIS